jgi:polyhydroxyalkanoate synthase
VLFVPSLINPPNVLDMGRRSLLRWLARRGTACCCSTGAGRGRSAASLSVGGHVEEICCR